MSESLVSKPFTSGELAPQLFGRTDLAAYAGGLAQCENWFVDYKGGISTRPGMEFVDYIKEDTYPLKLVPFRFAPNLANTYMVLFGHQYVRFLQGGAYVLEASKTITGITQANPGVVTTSAAHSFSNGDWVVIASVGGMTRLNGQRTFRIAGVTADTFQLVDPFGTNYNTTSLSAYTSGGTVSRIYTVTSPYSGSELAELKFDQIRDTLRLTHPDYAIRNLVRSSATSWAFATETPNNYGTKPGQPSVTVNSASSGTTTGASEGLYCVTAVDVDGQESLPSVFKLKITMAAYLDDPDLTATIAWTGVAGADFYRVYRSRIVNHVTGMTKGEAMGLIGETAATSLTDDDLVPDFTRTPPVFNDPFAHGAVESITITNGGTGYGRDDTIAVSGGGGSGFVGELIVVGGIIVGIEIINPGSGYSGASVAITTGAGVNAAFTVTLSESSGRNPQCSAIFQQRQMYAGLDVEPLSIYGSRVGRLSNFSESVVLIDSDGLHYELDSPVVVPIRHMVPTTNGLVVLAKDGVWVVSGGQEPAITPTNVLAEHFPSAGAANVAPVQLVASLLYLEDGGRAVRLLDFAQPNLALGGQDVSIISNHLFSIENQVTSWAFAAAPHSLLWARREDGTFLSFTFQPEHSVAAWATHSTAGLVEELASLEESDTDVVYLIVQRYVNSRWTKFIETLAPRTFADVEEAWAVDCGLSTTKTYPAAILTPGASTGTGITFTASGSVFVSGDVGKIIRGGGGKALITGYTSGTEVTATIQRDFTKLVPQTGRVVPIPSGEWSLDATFSTVNGLDHLEGQTVKVLLDGKVLADKTVSAGAISLGTTGSLCTVGLGFQAVAKTLPIAGGQDPIDASRKRIVGTAIRKYEAAGIKGGTDLDHLYELEEMISSNLGTAVTLADGYDLVSVNSQWTEDGQTYYVQDFPLPATILGLVLDLELGDDSN